MATILKRRRLINPGRRRKLSLKQKLFFGSKRQRAAAKMSLHRKRSKNPRKTLASKAKSLLKRFKTRRKVRRTRTKNIGTIFTIGLGSLNPGKKSKRRRNLTMARYSRKRRHVSKAKVSHRRRRRSYSSHRRRTHNPSYRMRRRYRHNPRHHRRYRRNPGFFSGGGMLSAQNVGGVLGGMALTAFITSKIPANWTSGFLKYVATGVVAFLQGTLVSKVAKKPALGNAMILGGVAFLVAQVLGDFAPGIAGYIPVKGGAMGIIGPGSFYQPQVLAPGGLDRYILPSAVANAIPAPAALKGLGSAARAPRTGRVS